MQLCIAKVVQRRTTTSGGSDCEDGDIGESSSGSFFVDVQQMFFSNYVELGRPKALSDYPVCLGQLSPEQRDATDRMFEQLLRYVRSDPGASPWPPVPCFPRVSSVLE